MKCFLLDMVGKLGKLVIGSQVLMVVICLCLLSGCGNGDGEDGTTPVFSLAWSEYPSWSVFGVADEEGIIDGEEGKMGPIEEKWGVDIVLKEADYDTCITLYGSSTVDAVCITNMDAMTPAASRDSAAILPTSTSDGADACIVVGGVSLESLKGKTTYGLEKTVAQYSFERCLIVAGQDPAEYPFKNMDPAAAATAMQTNQENIESIQVWNPFVLQTLRTRADSKVAFDSTSIPEEIIDMVVMGKDSLERPGGEDFACAVIDTFYEVCKKLDDPATADKITVAIGAKFSSLGLEDMQEVLTKTKLYRTPNAALGLYEGNQFQTRTMPVVAKFCLDHDIVDKEVTIGFGEDAQLNFDTSYIKKVQSE